jgi:hypothetical protein
VDDVGKLTGPFEGEMKRVRRLDPTVRKELMRHGLVGAGRVEAQEVTGERMNSTIEVKPPVSGEELKKLIMENISKVFEADSKHFIDGYIEHVAKEKLRHNLLRSSSDLRPETFVI